MRLFTFVVLALTWCCLVTTLYAQHSHHATNEGGIADPSKHPYADPRHGRSEYELSDEPVNEFRLYDFYQRQADYYMGRKVPRVLPAYPGLDAGLHGHWGKYNQNNHSDDRWNAQKGNNLLGACLHVGKSRIHKGINLRLGANGELSTCFDAWTFAYRHVWEGGFVKYDGYRWGTSRGVGIEGTQRLAHNGAWRNNRVENRMEDAEFFGVFRHGLHNAFSYRIGPLNVLDSPWAFRHGNNSVFLRRLKLSSTDSSNSSTLPLFDVPLGANVQSPIYDQDTGVTFYAIEFEGKSWCVSYRHAKELVVTKAADRTSLSIRMAPPYDNVVSVAIWTGDSAQLESAKQAMASIPNNLPSMESFATGGPAQWPETIVLQGDVSKAADAYVIDKLPVPFDNPYRSIMMFSGIDFLSNGDALVSTLAGDIWKVSGIDNSLRAVKWKRFAAGLHQPFGIKIVGDDIFVLCKDRMQILRDLNDDGEADYYENYDNSWVETHGHTHVFGADQDHYGNFYFPAYNLFYKLPPDGSGVKVIAEGFRNCMGVAVNANGLVLAAPQEGTWTPASAIIEVRDGEHYGFQRSNEPISPPMCFIPRGVDNSTGGMVFVDSDRWGPLGKSIVGLSYGSGHHYLILRDESVPRAQGATVPLKGEFDSGVVRGRINAKDGQLYVVGTQGWGNYAISDGCLYRIRYTGRPIYKPIGFQVFSNGIRIDFTEPLQNDVGTDISNYFAHQWNYEHSKGYGSVEYSVFRPHVIGHDSVTIRSVRLLNGAKSVFLEIPRIVPCYQMHLRMHLAAADGTQFKTDLFPTVLSLGKRFDFDGAAPEVPGRSKQLQLRVREPSKVVQKGHDPKLKVSRTITLNAIPGIRYDKTVLVVHPGEAIELKLVNKDGMPHNLVLVEPGAYEKIGRQAFKMLNDPLAFDRQYVPDEPEVITHTAVVFPNESSSAKFVTPKQPGAYPFFCTFPGHWQSMRGQLIVIDRNTPLPDPDSLTDESLTLAGQLTSENVVQLAAEIRASGDAKRGAKLFYNMRISCATCHDPSEGQRIGPPLTERHDNTSDTYLIESILSPSKVIRKGYESVTVMTFDGQMRTGVQVSETEKQITLRDLGNGGELLTYRKEDLDDLMHSTASSMPVGLVNNLNSREEFLDLMRFVFEVSDRGNEALQELK